MLLETCAGQVVKKPSGGIRRRTIVGSPAYVRRQRCSEVLYALFVKSQKVKRIITSAQCQTGSPSPQHKLNWSHETHVKVKVPWPNYHNLICRRGANYMEGQERLSGTGFLLAVKQHQSLHWKRQQWQG